jgi:translation initiation factor 4E
MSPPRADRFLPLQSIGRSTGAAERERIMMMIDPQQQQQQGQGQGQGVGEEEDLYDSPEDMTGGQKIIQSRYSFWYKQKGTKQQQTKEDYESSIKQLASFQTVEHFWRIYNHIQRAGSLPAGTDIHLFREGIKPAWEDSNNIRGGHWLMRLKKGLAARYWEELILAIIGEQFDAGNEICGAVVSVRYSEDIIYLWNRTADKREMCDKIRDVIRRILRLPSYIQLEYRRHQESLSGISQPSGSGGGNNQFQRANSWTRTGGASSGGRRRYDNESDGGLANVLGKDAVSGGGDYNREKPFRNSWDRRGAGAASSGGSSGGTAGGPEYDKEKDLSKWGNLRRGTGNVAAGPPPSSGGGGGHHHSLSAGPPTMSRFASDDRDDRPARPSSMRDGGSFMQANNRSDRDWSKLRTEKSRTGSVGSDGKNSNKV